MSNFSSSSRRGVYRLPWLGSEGEHLFAGVDRAGQRIFEVSLKEGQDTEEAVENLWGLLDLQDPITFRLVS